MRRAADIMSDKSQQSRRDRSTPLEGITVKIEQKHAERFREICATKGRSQAQQITEWIKRARLQAENSRDQEPGGLTDPPSLPLYSMQRCRKDNSRYGLIHFAHHESETLCGLSTNRYWWILTNNHNGTSNCPKCINANSRE